MRVHHINCGTMCPVGGSLMDGFSKGLTSKLSCHCLLIETESGLVLIDTGFGTQDIKKPKKRLSRFFLRANRIQLDPGQTAVAAIRRLGFQASDVRHIVLTHLDFDHAGGLSDFPQARVHLLQDELDSARKPKSWLDRQRYRHEQWDLERHWMPYTPEGEGWFGFECVKDLKGLPPEILLVPLAGHTHGHCGVAVLSDKGWLLHAGDAYFYRGEMDTEKYHCTPGLRLYQKMMEMDRKARLQNQTRLRNLINNHGDKIRVFSSHDHVEFAQCKALENHETTNHRTLHNFQNRKIKGPHGSPPPVDLHP